MFMQSRWDLGRQRLQSGVRPERGPARGDGDLRGGRQRDGAGRDRRSSSGCRWSLFPLIACQVYSAAGRVEMAVFFWSTRKQPATAPAVDLTPAYFLLCLISAEHRERAVDVLRRPGGDRGVGAVARARADRDRALGRRRSRWPRGSAGPGTSRWPRRSARSSAVPPCGC